MKNPKKEKLNLPTFRIDGQKIKSLEDVKKIIDLLNIHFTPPTSDDYEEFKHLLSPLEKVIKK
jgi:hypothetical protein